MKLAYAARIGLLPHGRTSGESFYKHYHQVMRYASQTTSKNACSYHGDVHSAAKSGFTSHRHRGDGVWRHQFWTKQARRNDGKCEVAAHIRVTMQAFVQEIRARKCALVVRKTMLHYVNLLHIISRYLCASRHPPPDASRRIQTHDANGKRSMSD